MLKIDATVKVVRADKDAKHKMAMFLEIDPRWFRNRKRGAIGQIEIIAKLPNAALYFVCHENSKNLALYTDCEIEEI